MSRLVDRYGRTGTAAITSAIWFLPMAAWAGSFDLSPMDKTAYPWIALGIGLVMLAAWLFLLTRLGRIKTPPRQHRLDLAQMSASEKRWSLGLLAFGAGLIAWLNAAATVDWTPLGAAIGAGKVGPTIFAVVLAALLLTLVAGVAWTWRRSTRAYRLRTSANRLE